MGEPSGPQNVLSQAERYSKGITQPAFQAGEYGVPLLYSTNGEVIWHHDVRNSLSRSRQIFEFHTPEAIEEVLAFDLDAAVEKLQSLAIRPIAGTQHTYSARASNQSAAIPKLSPSVTSIAMTFHRHSWLMLERKSDLTKVMIRGFI
jgi:type I site-specific restriction endonuclease